MTLRSGLNRDWSRFLGRTRAKCSYGPNHESVHRVGDYWLGESTNLFGCVMAPRDTCSICEGTGRVALSSQELAAEGADAASSARDKPCEVCTGLGTVPGAHWPWRHEHPGPLPTELL